MCLMHGGVDSSALAAFELELETLESLESTSLAVELELELILVFVELAHILLLVLAKKSKKGSTVSPTAASPSSVVGSGHRPH